MTIKKLTFCILCSVNAANLATEEDFNNEKSSNSEVEENVLINKNNWNTRKWGDMYFLFPHVSGIDILAKYLCGVSCVGKLNTFWKKIFIFIFSGVIEYKYMFHKYCGINVRLKLNSMEANALLDLNNMEANDNLNLNNMEANDNLKLNLIFSFFSLDPSLEWFYGRKGKHFFSGSFSPLGVAFVQNEKGELPENLIKIMWTFGFMLLKYEYDKRFYLNFGKIKTSLFSLNDICKEDPWVTIVTNFISIEFGLNIIGVNDWRKKKSKY